MRVQRRGVRVKERRERQRWRRHGAVGPERHQRRRACNQRTTRRRFAGVGRRAAAAAAAATATAVGASADDGHSGRKARVAEGILAVGPARDGAALVVQDGHADDALRRRRRRHVGRHVGRLQLGRQLTLPFVAPVLEPDLHLRIQPSFINLLVHNLFITQLSNHYSIQFIGINWFRHLN